MVANQRLINDVAVGLVFVQGPTPDLKMSLFDRVLALANVQHGLSWLGTVEPDAKVSWVYDGKVVNLETEPWANAPWPGMPREFYQDRIDAALWRKDNGKVYLFHKDRYLRFSKVSDGVDPGYPRPIAGNWHNLPPEFEAGIDAALWREANGKIYFFKEDQYVRLTGSTMDPNYPRPIKGNWQGLPEEFNQGIDAAFMHHDNNKIYFFKGDQYARLSDTVMDPSYPKPIAGNWKGLPQEFEDGIQAALWGGGNKKVYLFSRQKRSTLTEYVRFSDISQPVDPGYPKYVGGLDRDQAEALWRDPAQAALGVGPNPDGYRDYVAQLRAEHGTPWGFVAFITKYPVGWPAYAHPPKIVMAWSPGWTNFDRVFAHEVGHAFGGADEYSASNCACNKKEGRFFRVRNGNCRPCASSVSIDGGYPRKIAGSWPGLAADFEQDVDAAFWRESNQKIYLFKGDKYARLTGSNMDVGYPRTIAGNWQNLPASFNQDIDAALWRKSDGRIYLFKGSQYVRLTGSTVDPGYPRSIAGDWKDLPAAFEQGIDAVLWRESNDKIYMFKGNQYVRLTETTKDPGYPKSISPNWQGLPAEFNQGIDAAFMRRSNGRIYFFRGDDYVRLSNGVPCLMSGNAGALCQYTWYHLGWGAFMNKIDAAVHRGDNDKIYLFSGAWYVRYSDLANGIDEGYPKRIAGNWRGLPPAFKKDLDAALWRESNGKTYLFKGGYYVRLTGNSMDSGYPKPIDGPWKGLPPAFNQGIDAAFLRESNNKIYMFKDDQYVRLTGVTVDPGYPRPISPHWNGVPPSYANGIHAALMLRGTGRIYMFNGRTYLRFSNVGAGVDPGYPRWIDGAWMPFPRS